MCVRIVRTMPKANPVQMLTVSSMADRIYPSPIFAAKLQSASQRLRRKSGTAN